MLTRPGLQKALRSAAARREPFGVILFSIDRFKLINSRFGHERADDVLQAVADTARKALHGAGKLGRWGGDEFLCILPDVDHRRCRAIAETLRHTIELAIIPVGGTLINASASFGFACAPDDAGDEVTLVVLAAEALHRAKRAGRNRVLGAMDLPHRMFQMGEVLERALREERVIPAYQPIIDLHTGDIVAEEALARIVTTEGDVIAAENFIDVASEFQLVHKIDRTIISSALNRSLAGSGDRSYFINISGDLLRHPDVLKEMLIWARSHYHKCAVIPLVIEVTERELLTDTEDTLRMLQPFLDLGLRLALDDFGSGYSSFQYLADLPVSFLKIDGRLIRRMQEPKVRGIVHGIQAIAAELGLVTLAEYVETAEQAENLRRAGINWGQGHLFGSARLNEDEADARREMSVNWTGGYYYRKRAADG